MAEVDDDVRASVPPSWNVSAAADSEAGTAKNRPEWGIVTVPRKDSSDRDFSVPNGTDEPSEQDELYETVPFGTAVSGYIRRIPMGQEPTIAYVEQAARCPDCLCVVVIREIVQGLWWVSVEHDTTCPAAAGITQDR